MELDCGLLFDIAETFGDKNGQFAFETVQPRRRGCGLDYWRCRVRPLLKGFLGKSPIPVERAGLRGSLLRTIDLGVTTLFELNPSTGAALLPARSRCPKKEEGQLKRSLAVL